MFAQARHFLDQLERGFRSRESTLDAREAALASREAELAEARVVFQETVQHAAEQHRGAEAVLAMKTRQLTRLREDTERDVEIANVGLDHHRRKVRALTEKLAEQRALLEDREASAAEASTKLQRILVAALAAEKRSAGQLAAAEERHQEELAAATADLKLALEKQDRVVTALWDELAQKEAAREVLDGALKNLGERLGEAARREATAREEAAAVAAKLAGKEEEASELRAEVAAAKKQAADLERTLMSHLRDKNIGMSRLRDAVDRAAEAMLKADLVPAERTKDYLHDKLEDHARFLDSLSGQLAGLRESFEDTLSQEGKQVAEAIATHILSRLHHRDPAFPVDAIFARITPPAKRAEAEAAVAAHVAELTSRMARK